MKKIIYILICLNLASGINASIASGFIAPDDIRQAVHSYVDANYPIAKEDPASAPSPEQALKDLNTILERFQLPESEKQRIISDLTPISKENFKKLDRDTAKNYRLILHDLGLIIINKRPDLKQDLGQLKERIEKIELRGFPGVWKGLLMLPGSKFNTQQSEPYKLPLSKIITDRLKQIDYLEQDRENARLAKLYKQKDLLDLYFFVNVISNNPVLIRA